MAIRDVLVDLQTRTNTKPLDGVNAKIKGIAGAFAKVGGIIAGAFVTGKIASAIHEQIQLGDQLGETSTALGITAGKLQSLGFAAEREGSSVEGINKSLFVLSKNALHAAEGNEEAAKLFKKLGVDVKGADGKLRTVDAIFRDVAEGASKLGNDTELAAVSQELLGKSGKDLIPLLKKGGAGVDDLDAKFKALGGGLSDEFVAQASDAADSIQALRVSFLAMSSGITLKIVPAVLRVTSAMARWFRAASAAGDIGGVVTRVFKGLGLALVALIPSLTAIAIRMALANASVVGAALIFAAFLVVLEDVVAFTEGKKSAIGAFFTQWRFGVWIANQLSAAWETYAKVMGKVFGVLDGVAGTITALGRGVGLKDALSHGRLAGRVGEEFARKNISNVPNVIAGDIGVPTVRGVQGAGPAPVSIQNNVSVQGNASRAQVNEVRRAVQDGARQQARRVKRDGVPVGR